MNGESSASGSEDLERRVEALASELALLINSSNSEDREGLKDLALSIVREEVQGRDVDPPGRGTVAAGGPGSSTGSAAPFNAIAVAMPLGLAGAVMVFLFPLGGLVLFALAGLLVAFGVLASFFAKR